MDYQLIPGKNPKIKPIPIDFLLLRGIELDYNPKYLFF
jgi:hypothetical protein